MISRDRRTTTPQQFHYQGITSRSMMLAIAAYLLTSLPATEATGWWRKGVRSAGRPLLFSSTGGAVDDDIDAALRKIEQEQVRAPPPLEDAIMDAYLFLALYR